MYTFELNNERRDANFVSGQVRGKSPVVEIFSAMAQGKDLSKFGKAADKAVNYIKELNSKAVAGDMVAVSELNEIRRFAMQPLLLEEMKLLGIFGTYKNIGYNESCEIEVPEIVKLGAKEQAFGEDVQFPKMIKRRVPVATTTISAGYAVDYRKAMLGDMSDEHELQNQVKIQMRNLAARLIVEKVYRAIKEATGVKYMFEGEGLTKTGVDKVLTDVRRFGKPSVIGDYALISQFNDFAGYQGTTPVVSGISLKVMDEIHETGLMGMYNGAILSELPNPYDLTRMNADGTNFETMFPAGLGFVLPAGAKSPIHTITRGGLTSFSGNDVTTGELISRFDMEIGCLVEPGKEHQVALLNDTRLSGLK